LAAEARGRFITLEGGEGGGKSTQAALLAEALCGAGIPVLKTREPGGSPGAEAIRSLLVSGTTDRWDPMTEALLVSAARRDHLTRTIWPALESGTWVVCDRFMDSTRVYQGCGGGLESGAIADLYRLVAGDFRPDLTLILDIQVAAGMARAAERAGSAGETRFERMGREFHERIREGFLDIARGEPERCVVIDAGGDVGSVRAAIWAAVQERLGVASRR
jgi:dTMP kinase